jgi:hypothetical protein
MMTPAPGDSASAGTIAVEDIMSGAASGGVGRGQQHLNMAGYEIETVYQLLGLGSSDPAHGGGGSGGGGIIGQKDAEWMYQLKAQGGDELHTMSVAFDAFRAGNLNLACQTFEALARKARAANLQDRYTLNKLRYLVETRTGVAAATGRMSSLGGLVPNLSLTGSSLLPSGLLAGMRQSRPTSRLDVGMASAAVAASSDGIVATHANSRGEFDESSAGGELFSRATASTAQMMNPRRTALDSFFEELRMQRRRYARRVFTTGADDFSFE